MDYILKYIFILIKYSFKYISVCFIISQHSPKGDDVVGEIQVVAIGSYDSTTDSVLSFKKGTLASLLLQSDSNWWCIRLGSAHGWVPAAYWRMLNVSWGIIWQRNYSVKTLSTIVRTGRLGWDPPPRGVNVLSPWLK